MYLISSVPLISLQPTQVCWFTITNKQVKYNKVGSVLTVALWLTVSLGTQQRGVFSARQQTLLVVVLKPSNCYSKKIGFSLKLLFNHFSASHSVKSFSVPDGLQLLFLLCTFYFWLNIAHSPWTCLLFLRSSQNYLATNARHSEREKKTRQTEEEVWRQHQEMDRPGVCWVPEGSGEQGKMEETGCQAICGAPTAVMVKG